MIERMCRVCVCRQHMKIHVVLPFWQHLLSAPNLAMLNCLSPARNRQQRWKKKLFQPCLTISMQKLQQISVAAGTDNHNRCNLVASPLIKTRKHSPPNTMFSQAVTWAKHVTTIASMQKKVTKCMNPHTLQQTTHPLPILTLYTPLCISHYCLPFQHPHQGIYLLAGGYSHTLPSPSYKLKHRQQQTVT